MSRKDGMPRVTPDLSHELELGAIRNMSKFPAVTRVEVIDFAGRSFSRHYSEPGVEVHIQDDGRTMKLFVG